MKFATLFVMLFAMLAFAAAKPKKSVKNGAAKKSTTKAAAKKGKGKKH